jgi:hypothetical protein
MTNLGKPQGIAVLRFSPNSLILGIVSSEVPFPRLNAIFVDKEHVADTALSSGAWVFDPLNWW